MHKKLVIIAAGGTGSRINNNIPKQFLLLDNKPILMRTIEKFYGIADRIIVSIHPEMMKYWKSLCKSHHFDLQHELVKGGSTRFQSVQNALNYFVETTDTAIEKTSIAIHDAARPLVDRLLIERAFDLAITGKCSCLALKSTNSVRIGTSSQSKSISREMVWIIQTPQTFPAKIITEAYKQEESSLFTDDCTVVEKLGHSIEIIESTPKNIKITFIEDLKIAELYIREGKNRLKKNFWPE